MVYDDLQYSIMLNTNISRNLTRPPFLLSSTYKRLVSCPAYVSSISAKRIASLQLSLQRQSLTQRSALFHTSAVTMGGDNYINGGNFTHNNTTAPEYSNKVLPLFQLTGRTAIVSGAGAGIGLAVAQALAEAGANVAIWYNSNKKAIEEAAKIEKAYGVKCTYTVI